MNREQWNKTHKACPKCGSEKTIQSLVGVAEIEGEYHDSVNTATCSDCGWAGMVKDLVPPKGYKPETAQEKQGGAKITEDGKLLLELKTVDYNGLTYVCAADVVENIGEFGEQLMIHLKDESAKQFTKQVLGEVLKMLIMADKQHWMKKASADARDFRQAADVEPDQEETKE